ncbi:PREDICTED: uncharacterized protein LOC108661145 [Theobroma cacao]|uniref:Uncharacterized protein LOC108661145 n=1 Tax=Theobroma cacao TaxID=3641 RepID=A0AB32W355_THECC|nr:PREDICTED: uncharacterized protein LOC108661145 [Theobroma cacao]
MPLSIARKLGFQEIQPTIVTLQLVDRTIRHPVGIIKDVLLEVGHLYIQVDFIVLKIEDDVEIPFILGRPFLATVGALIDVKNGKITFRVGEQEVLLQSDLLNEVKGRFIPPPSTEKAPILETKPPPLSSYLDLLLDSK